MSSRTKAKAAVAGEGQQPPQLLLRTMELCRLDENIAARTARAKATVERAEQEKTNLQEQINTITMDVDALLADYRKELQELLLQRNTLRDEIVSRLS